ncbi:hypothetical protein N6B72_05160 [Chryseobacterium soli]|uniref:hypothetical protein n=1 Tax=Chryseobacterium soli TaxID=445961 RepID=UPI002954B1C5|nr:hypothetical protein [Chryseobacterium soli]MDV7696304.1 hypothetical protein [Chryseobacterium soli]
MEIVVEKTKKKISIEKVQNKNEEIIIQEGLLTGKIFLSDELQEIKNGESVDCYGAKPGFTKGFSLGFNS